jgi:hypothetical protein
MTNPKIFLSYSWTSEEHSNWVLQLATDLRGNGVDAILDKWHLKEGQDAHAFMERMVTDESVKKVAVICDRKYVERSDAREGGVGAESQIMSAELYGQVDQIKFVAICREKDEHGRALLPTFFKSRIYIDLSPDADYALGFEQLLRWCFGKPLYVEPELGEPPAFLDQQIAPVVTRALPFDRVLRDPFADNQSIVNAAVTFLRELRQTSVDFTITFEGEEPEDEQIVRKIEGLTPILSRLLKVVDRGLAADGNGQIQAAFHDYLEKMIPALQRGATRWSADVTKFYAQFIFVAFIGLAIRNRRFSDATTFLNTPFVKDEFGEITATSVRYQIFRTHLESLEARNNRLQLRRTSFHADLIRQVCDAAAFPFREYVEADFLLYLRGVVAGHDDPHAGGPYLGWWPISAIYVADAHSALPSFVRAEQPAFRDEFLSVLDIGSKEKLEELIAQYRDGKIEPPRWQSAFSRLDVLSLMNADKIVASYA